MGPAAIPIIAIAVSTASLGYGVYAGERAAAAQRNAVSNAENQQRQQQQLQDQQFQQQQQQQAQQLQDQKIQQAQTVADTKAAQEQALAAEQAAIGTNTNTLSNSLSQQSQQALSMQDPLIQSRLNSMGILNSGAYAAQLAKYQADLQSQAQTQLANYQIGAQGQLTQNTNATTADQVHLAEQNALNNIQSGQQNMAQNFATQNVNNQNNVAYQQYIANLRSAQAQSQQASANSYSNLGGQLGGSLLNYYGSRASSPGYTPYEQYQAFQGYTPSAASMSYENAAQRYQPDMSSSYTPYSNYSPQQNWNPAIQALRSSGPYGI